MIPRRSCEPSRLFSWEVAQARTGGVTDDPRRAIDQVNAALARAPRGARATVTRVDLILDIPSKYDVVAVVGRARTDQTTGEVVWEIQ
ncbi:hypothetical protein [Spirillospora sp. NPDC047279]|uniref:hypothetical protein n=1 Tax=Spirillospora sp. NPDC047279 TaxID=3155478 RepID=UPI0033DBC84D